MKLRAGKVIICLLTTLVAITGSFTIFTKSVFAENNACSTEIVYNSSTNASYCMPVSIYNGPDTYKDQYRLIVRTGVASQEDVDLLENLSQSIQNFQQWWGSDDKTISGFIHNYAERINAVFNAVRGGYYGSYTQGLFNKLLGHLGNSGFASPVAWQQDLEQMQTSGYRNYYTEGSNNNYYSGDTVYNNFYYDGRVYYENNYYEINNYYYNFINNQTTYNVNNDFYFNITYNIDNTVINIVNNGVSNTSTYYFKLPDGRNSYNLSAENIRGYKVDLSVFNYDEFNSDNDLIGLFHFDGNKQNSAFYNVSSNINNSVLNYIDNISSLRGNLLSNQLMSVSASINDFDQLDYIQSSGTQYIDTGVAPSSYPSTLKIVADMQYTDISANSYLFGSGIYASASENRKNYAIGVRGSNFVVTNMTYGGNSNSIITADTNRHIFTLDRPNLTASVDNTSISISNKSITDLSRTLVIFGSRAVSSSGDTYGFISSAKLYSFKIYSGTTLIRDFIPVKRKSDNEVGLFDTINNQFYTNVGTGTFTYGSVITQNEYTISATVNPSGAGSVSGTGTYTENSSVTLTASPSSGYVFSGWSNGSTQNPYTFNATQDLTLTANFTQASVTYLINADAYPSGSGSVTGSGYYAEGSTVTLTAVPTNGYRFVSWTGGSTQNPLVFTADENRSIIASFELAPTYSSDELFSISPNTITYLNDNSNFNEFLYIGSGENEINIDMTSSGNEIDFRFYPVKDKNFSLVFNDDLSFEIEQVVETLYNSSVTSNNTIISYSMSTSNAYYHPLCGTGATLVHSSSSNYVVGDGTTLYNWNYACSYPNTSVTQIPTNIYSLELDENSQSIRFGEWNHIAIQRSGDMWINGEYFGNNPLFSNTDILNIKLTTDQYCYFDELRITKTNKYSNSNIVSNLSFTPPSLPYDTNIVFILPSSAPNGALLIQSTIPVNSWQFGGVRPSNPLTGDVYLSVTDYGLLNTLQQFDGTDWVEKKGAIYNQLLDLWVSYYGYSIFTNNWSYNDLSEMNVNDIITKQDFFGWLGAWFTKLKTSIEGISVNITNTINNSEDNSSSNEITNEIINNNEINVSTDLNLNINNMINTAEDIDLQLPEYNIGTDLKNDLQNLSPTITGVFNVFSSNGIGWLWILPLVIAILGVVL